MNKYVPPAQVHRQSIVKSLIIAEVDGPSVGYFRNAFPINASLQASWWVSITRSATPERTQRAKLAHPPLLISRQLAYSCAVCGRVRFSFVTDFSLNEPSLLLSSSPSK
jgi:hypothetical protein